MISYKGFQIPELYQEVVLNSFNGTVHVLIEHENGKEAIRLPIVSLGFGNDDFQMDKLIQQAKLHIDADEQLMKQPTFVPLR